jgi:hypothetical protein
MALKAKDIARLGLRRGDVLTVRCNGFAHSKLGLSVTEQVRQLLAECAIEDIAVIFLGPGVELDAVSEATMARHGWVRAQREET